MTASVGTTDPRRSGSSDNRDPEDFPAAVVDAAVEFLGKPRARGWIHVYSAVIAAIAGAALVSVSWSLQGTRAGLATLLYTFTIVAMFAVSGTYHRVNWKSETARKWMKRADHSMIFIFIAGSYTPFAVVLLPWEQERTLLILVWTGAILGVLFRVFWVGAPRWLYTPIYIALGWVALFYLPAFWATGGPLVVILLALGGIFYSVGGVVYALKRPNP